MLSLAVTDTPEQTRAVLRSLARSKHSAGAEQVDYDRWHRLQRWQAAGQRNVIIPSQINWQIVFLHLPFGSGVILMRC
jgi:hypothetical protein